MSAERRAPPPGELRLGPLTIALPDASTPELVLDEDLTGLCGVETNGEAEARLQAALGRGARGIEIDSEAGSVLVHASGAAAMLRVLAALDAIAVERPLWTPDELERAALAMRAHRRPRPARYDAGALVAVPLEDGTFGALHVGAFDDAGSLLGSPLALALDVRASSLEALVALLAGGAGAPVACRVIDDAAIRSGEWALVGTRAIDERLAQALLARERGSSSSGSAVPLFLRAWFGLVAWDVFGSPLEHDRLLLAGVAPAASRRSLRELVRARVEAAHGARVAPISQGPALLDVRVAHPGATPRPIDLPKARRLAERMGADVPGAALVLTGASEGFLDVFATTTDAAAGLAATLLAARDLGLERDTLAEALPPVALDGLRPW